MDSRGEEEELAGPPLDHLLVDVSGLHGEALLSAGEGSG